MEATGRENTEQRRVGALGRKSDRKHGREMFVGGKKPVRLKITHKAMAHVSQINTNCSPAQPTPSPPAPLLKAFPTDSPLWSPPDSVERQGDWSLQK